MYTLSRQSFVLLACGFVLGCVLLGLLVAWPVRADVGVQPILPDGSGIQPRKETPIQMASEKVVLNVRQATEWDSAAVTFNPQAYGLKDPFVSIWQLSVAEVTADFTMANPTSEAVSITVWFPLASALETEDWEGHMGEIVPRIEGFQVAVDGKPLAHNVSDWPNPKGGDKPSLPWASFPVTFPAGESVLIQVTYLIWAQLDIDGVGMNLTYIFQTGAGWAGPIGQAELMVNLPYLASAETIGAMPDGGQVAGHQVRWTWTNWEPTAQDDFFIWLIRQERWEGLEAARMRATLWPEDGEAWLNLADTYLGLTLGKYQMLPGFGQAFQPLGVQAARKALRLLPSDGRPHADLAIFYLAVLPRDPTPKELQPVLDELEIVEELAPEYASGVHLWLEWHLSEDQWVSLHADWATQTAVAASMQTPSATPSPSPTPIPSATPSPSATPPPLPTLTANQPGNITSDGHSLVIVVAVGVVGLIAVGYLALNRTRRISDS